MRLVAVSDWWFPGLVKIWSRFDHIRLVVVVFGGALYMRRRPRIRVKPQMNGGGYERRIKSGTVPTLMVCWNADRVKKVDMKKWRL
ncbi:hypothetical protein Tco_0008254 [Tanacetum coccineum]